MVSVDTWLKENPLLLLNFFFIAFIPWWKANFLIMKLIVTFFDNLGVSSSQLNRFKGPVFDQECFMKFAVISFYFTCSPRQFGITINTKLVKVLQFGLFIQICQIPWDILDRFLKSLSLLEGIINLTNTIKQPIQYILIIVIYKPIIGKRFI